MINVDEFNENNNTTRDSKVPVCPTKPKQYQCIFCDFDAKTVSELEDNAIEVHEQCAHIARKFKELNSEAIKTPYK